VGTTLYKAPELYHRVELGYTSAVDIWSLGAVAFCIRTGLPPFRSDAEITLYSVDQLPFPTSSLNSSTQPCRDFILKTMHKLPNQRPTIDQVMEHEWIRSSNNNETTNSRYVYENFIPIVQEMTHFAQFRNVARRQMDSRG
jgi:serine/threonine protein kinase